MVLMTDWEVSIYCASKRHNTLNSSYRHGTEEACICPHAVELRSAATAAYRERKREVPSAQRMVMPRPQPQPIAAANYPDFTGGLCTSERGEKTAREGMNDQVSRKGIRDRERAKSLCNAGPCPIRDTLCRPWVLGQESPPGSWGGVWGGMDPWNRRGLQLVFRDGKAETVPYDISRS